MLRGGIYVSRCTWKAETRRRRRLVAYGILDGPGARWKPAPPATGVRGANTRGDSTALGISLRRHHREGEKFVLSWSQLSGTSPLALQTAASGVDKFSDLSMAISDIMREEAAADRRTPTRGR